MKQTKETTMPYVKIKSKGQVTIPIKIRRTLGCDEGDLLEATVQGNTIVLKPQTVVDRDAVDAAIDEGLHDFQEERVHGPFESMDDFKRSLADDA